jgi:hypothetical protein
MEPRDGLPGNGHVMFIDNHRFSLQLRQSYYLPFLNF